MVSPVYILAGQSNALALGGKNGGVTLTEEYQALTGSPTVQIATVAANGAPLTWGRAGPDWYHPDDMLSDLVATIVGQLSQPGTKVASVIWVQGEADTYGFARASEYGARMMAMVYQLEQALAPLGIQTENFRFTVLALSADCPSAVTRSNWALIRQQQLALNDPRIDVIDPDAVAAAVGMSAQDFFQTDGLHYNAAANATILAALLDKTPVELIGTGSDDDLRGLSGDDLLRGGSGNDLLVGGAGNDILGGWLGSDTIYGGAGDDRIAAGSGQDVLFGGSGADVFSFYDRDDMTNIALNHDRIMDFTHGKDQLQLSTIDADPSRSGNQAFRYLGSAAFDGKPAALHTYLTATGIDAALDLDGDKRADLTFSLEGLSMLSSVDFVL